MFSADHSYCICSIRSTIPTILSSVWPSVSLSVTLCIVAKPTAKSMSKFTGRGPKNGILQLSTPYTDPIPSNSSPLEPHTLLPSNEYIKTYYEQENRQSFHVWNSMLLGYSTQCRTSGFLSNCWASCFFSYQDSATSVRVMTCCSNSVGSRDRLYSTVCESRPVQTVGGTSWQGIRSRISIIQ